MDETPLLFLGFYWLGGAIAYLKYDLNFFYINMSFALFAIVSSLLIRYYTLKLSRSKGGRDK